MRTIGGKAWLALSTGVSGCYRCSCFCCRCLESTVGQEHSTLHFRTRSLDHFRTEWRPSAIWTPGIRLIALQAQICHIPVFCPHAGYSSPRPSALGPYLPTSLLPLCLPHHSAPPTAPPVLPFSVAAASPAVFATSHCLLRPLSSISHAADSPAASPP